ncbi:MAG: hypothetical protein C1O27_001261 [Chloroflexi bacterium]|nr:MAG: hypothetical protein C1O27_001261 [Chloroflexota bacterium]
MLTVLGSIAVAVMMGAYWLEPRSKWFVLLFAAGSAATSIYSGLVAAYPITVIEAIWTVVALQRFIKRSTRETAQGAPSRPSA